MPPKQLGVSEIDVRNTIHANYFFKMYMSNSF